MLSARCLAVVLAAATSLTAATASAQDDAPAATIPVPAWQRAPHQDDVVVMTDGGMARGVVFEVLPKDHVAVRLTDGRTMFIPWDRVHHIEQGAPLAETAPVAAPPARTAAPPTAPAASPTDQGTVDVHVVGSGAALERERAGQWQEVCTAPCDRTLDLDAFYRIGGKGIRTSKPFRLLAKPGDRLTITADTSSTAAFALGITLASVGAIVGTVSYYGFVLAGASGVGYYRHDNGALAGFAIALLGSAAVGTTGLVVAVNNEKSGATQSVGGATPVSASRSPDRVRASEPDRIPSWTSMGSAVPEQRGAPGAMGVPLLGGRF